MSRALFGRSRRNPKGPKFTPEQEAEYERYEANLCHARILELGVAAFLNGHAGEYAKSDRNARGRKRIRACR